MESDRECSNLRLNTDNFKVIVRARGGLKTSDLANSRDLLDFKNVTTTGGICFLQIGGNDLCNARTTPQDVVRHITGLADFLLVTKQFRFVIIGQLLRRHPSKVGEAYNRKVIDTCTCTCSATTQV